MSDRGAFLAAVAAAEHARDVLESNDAEFEALWEAVNLAGSLLEETDEPMKEDHLRDEDGYEALEFIGLTHRLVAMPAQSATFAAVIQVTSPSDAALVTPDQAIELAMWLLRQAGSPKVKTEWGIRWERILHPENCGVVKATSESNARWRMGKAGWEGEGTRAVGIVKRTVIEAERVETDWVDVKEEVGG